MPRITEITVSSGRVIPHPYESYANLRPAVSLRAELLEREDAAIAGAILAARCEQMLDDHVALIHESLKVARAAKIHADELADVYEDDAEIEEDE